jgi:hypothetical protein
MSYLHCAGCTKRLFSKAAANYPFLRGGWDDPNCARPTRGVFDRALREHGDRPSYPISFFSILLGIRSGSRQACFLRETGHEVHGLNRLACGAFHQIIQRGYRNDRS